MQFAFHRIAHNPVKEQVMTWFTVVAIFPISCLLGSNTVIARAWHFSVRAALTAEKGSSVLAAKRNKLSQHATPLTSLTQAENLAHHEKINGKNKFSKFWTYSQLLPLSTLNTGKYCPHVKGMDLICVKQIPAGSIWTHRLVEIETSVILVNVLQATTGKQKSPETTLQIKMEALKPWRSGK